MEPKPTTCPISIADMSMADPAINACPYDFYARMHAEAPVYHDKKMNIWIISRYPDIIEACNNWHVFSSQIDMRRDVSALDPTASDEMFRTEGWLVSDVLSQVDPPTHTVYRRIVQTLFTGLAVKRLHAYLDAHVVELIDSFAPKGEADFLNDFALFLPLDVIADQLGLPRSHGARLRRWTDAFIASFDPTISAERKLDLTQEILEFQMYFVAWRQKKIETPAEDLLSMLSTLEKDDGQRLGTEEYLALCAQLMVAGNETTRNHLLAAMEMLCEDPALQDRLRQDPALIPNFIEESLRLESPAQGLYRRCTQDIMLGGVTIPAGAIVLVMYGAGNRDAEVFADPERIDLARANRNRHLAFGHGIRTCIGRSLATAELTIAFSRLLERLHNIRLSSHHPAPGRKFHFNMRALESLHIEFDTKPEA
jgi:cytochrome P450